MKKLILDIKPPQKKKLKKKKIAPKLLFEAQPKTPLKKPSSEKTKLGDKSFRPVFLALGVLVSAAIIFSVIGLFELKNTVVKSAPELYTKFEQAKSALEKFDTRKAKDFFGGINEEIKSIKSKAEKYGLLQISELWSSVMPKIKTIPEAFANLAALGETTFRVSANLEELKNNGLRWFTNQQGNLLINNFETTKENLAKLSDSITYFQNQEFQSWPFLNDNFLNQSVNLIRAEKFMGSLVDWFKNPGDKHILIAFQNPSELRPSGGFMGSYADATLNRNGLQDVKVWNIYDPDGQLKIKVVPPYELQGITPRWGARDANWFFDFPASAKKIISFLEKSLIYQEKGITFDGLIAINVHVMESILKALGPIELKEYKLTITPENFLPEIQREVESGKDIRGGRPKRILKILTPILFEKLSQLDESQKIFIFRELKKHVQKKDIMFFFKNLEIQKFLENLNLAGKIYEAEENSDGDYLAVVSSNIGGGKTDAFIKSVIKLSSKIEPDGRINNFLSLEKTHAGNNQKESWYRRTNRSYLKIFTPKGSRLTYIDGQSSRKIKPLVNYAASFYLTDPDLKKLENTKKTIKEFGIHEFIESGKTVFGFWMDTRPGKTKKIEVQYFNPRRLILHKNSIPYKFIFEKQSGANVSFDFLIEAPPGYVWADTGSIFFNYVNPNPDGREIINLTLVSNPKAN